MRACALGARAAFAGKAFLWALGALGEDGSCYVADLLIEETQARSVTLGGSRRASFSGDWAENETMKRLEQQNGVSAQQALLKMGPTALRSRCSPSIPS